jgi:FkbM family methyltransferase
MLTKLAGRDVAVGSGRDWFWGTVENGEWEPATLGVLAVLCRPGVRLADIGAWIGPVTLYAAAAGAEVHAYEPDPAALGELRDNLELNPDLASLVTVHPYGLAATDGAAALSSGELGDSGASLVRTGAATATVEVRDIRGELAGDLGQCDVVKIDIEGAEYTVVPLLLDHLRRARPTLLLSLHTHTFREPVAHLPWLVRGVLYRLRAIPRQAVTVLRLRFYPHRYELTERSWRRIGLVRTLRLIGTVGGTELVLAAHPLPEVGQER